MKRRTYLTAFPAIVGLSSGCLREKSAYGLKVINSGDVEYSIEVVVTETDTEENILSRTFSLDSNDSEVVEEIFDLESDFHISASLQGNEFETDFDPGDDSNPPVNYFQIEIGSEKEVLMYLPVP